METKKRKFYFIPLSFWFLLVSSGFFFLLIRCDRLVLNGIEPVSISFTRNLKCCTKWEREEREKERVKWSVPIKRRGRRKRRERRKETEIGACKRTRISNAGFLTANSSLFSYATLCPSLLSSNRNHLLPFAERAARAGIYWPGGCVFAATAEE